MRSFSNAAVIGACLASVFLVSSCADADSTNSAGTQSSDASSASATGSSAPKKTPSFSVDEADLAFDLPSGWEAFDRAKFQEALSDSTAMGDLTDRLGVSREQFRQLMASNLALFVTAPHAVAGFLDNVNVLVLEGKLPAAGTLELQYRGLGATDIDSEDVSTAVGDGYAITYTLEVNGTKVAGRAITLGVDNQVVAITISCRDAKRAAKLKSLVIDSLVESS